MIKRILVGLAGATYTPVAIQNVSSVQSGGSQSTTAGSRDHVAG